MHTSVSVTAELFTKAIECKELVESPPKMTRVTQVASLCLSGSMSKVPSWTLA